MFSFLLYIAVLDVDGVADKYSGKSIVHIMFSSWPSSKFSMTNAAHANQISLALRPLLRIEINNYTINDNVLLLRTRTVVLLIKFNIFFRMHACVNTCSKVGWACFTDTAGGRAEPNLISGTGFFLTGVKNMRVALILAP